MKSDGRSRWTRVMAAASVVAALTIGCGNGTRAAARNVTIEWSCFNMIHWDDPSRPGRWWVSDVSAITGRLEAAPTLGHRAVGKVVFHDAERATFVASTGGRIPLTFEPLSTAHDAMCVT